MTDEEGTAMLLDALVLSLEAGLGFDPAVRAIAASGGPVARHARVIATELALGRGRDAALRRFAAGLGDEARQTAALLAMSQRLGAPLADALAVHADALRAQRRRRVEAAARRLPVLMLFPLSFCILPALLIVFLGPPLLSLLR